MFFMIIPKQLKRVNNKGYFNFINVLTLVPYVFMRYLIF